MNAYHETQISGICWPNRPQVSLYRPEQAALRSPEPRQRIALFEGLERQMAEFAAQHKVVLSEVRKHYVIPPDSSVTTFLTEHRTIPQILLEAAPQLKLCFGANSVFNLRAPVDAAGSRTLYAVAMWPGKLRDVRQALVRFDDAWWIARSRQASGYLVFTYELT